MSAPARTYWESFGEDTPYWETREISYAEPGPQLSEPGDGTEDDGARWVEREKDDLKALFDKLGMTQLSRDAAEGLRRYVAVSTLRSFVNHKLNKAEAEATLGRRNAELEEKNRKLRAALSYVPSAEDVQCLRALTTDISKSGMTVPLWDDLQQALGSTVAKLSAVNRKKADISQSGGSDTDMIET